MTPKWVIRALFREDCCRYVSRGPDVHFGSTLRAAQTYPTKRDASKVAGGWNAKEPEFPVEVVRSDVAEREETDRENES